MQRAQKHNAVKNQKFFARKHMAPPPSSYEEVEGKEKASKCSVSHEDSELKHQLIGFSCAANRRGWFARS